MANPTLLSVPLCRDAEKNTIPVTDNGTTGKFSEQYGWQGINSLPLSAGGKAVERLDFNGVLALLGGIDYMTQRGYTFEYDNTLPYVAGCIVVDPLDGKTYRCINDVPIGASNPSNDPINWIPYDIADYVGGALRSKAYNVGDTSTLVGIPAGYFLECTTAGTTATNAPTFPQPVTAGQTITDGTVVWTVRQCFPTSGGALLGDIRTPTDNVRIKVIGGSTEVTGAELFLSGVDYVNPTLPAGSFLLQTCDGVNFPYLRGTPDGKLIWAGNSLDWSTVTAIDTGVNGYVKTKSGLMIAWGIIETESNLSGEVIYPVSFSVAVMVGGTYYRATPNTFSITGYDLTKFNWTRQSNQYSIRWVAVGK